MTNQQINGYQPSSSLDTNNPPSGNKKKLKIVLDQYDHKCGDGCCDHYGTVTTINGITLDCHNQDTKTILEQILEHLGYEVEIQETFNGEE